MLPKNLCRRITEQDLTSILHSHSIEYLITKEKDLEKIVSSNANKLKLKVIVYNNKMVIFS
jgi:formyltetrahydrofolate hydrolase